VISLTFGVMETSGMFGVSETRQVPLQQQIQVNN
jgi:hypothetical protein